MGMDVCASKPTGKARKYFCRSNRAWYPLALLCQVLAPDITSACDNWYSNDGNGLDNARAKKLAKRLRMLLADGSVAEFLGYQNHALAETKDRYYQPCGEADVQEWIAFLEACGGFSIY